MLIDEYQHVPEVLDAIKAELNRDLRPGRYAVGEILKQVSWWDAPVLAGHFRTGVGDEVDLILERDDGQVFAFEIKAGSRINSEDVRGIQSLQSKLGRRLAAAIILHTGAHSYTHGGITALPLDRLWQ